jgi:hypothetical protein
MRQHEFAMNLPGKKIKYTHSGADFFYAARKKTGEKIRMLQRKTPSQPRETLKNLGGEALARRI